MGLSDRNPGVQWNTGVRFEPLGSWLGVNLEGMAYDGWPIAQLIQRELNNPALFKAVRTIPKPADVELRWYRDYWQVQSRPPIIERLIAPTPLSLEALRSEDWHRALLEAQSCLDACKGYRGRSWQVVTLAASRRKVRGSVSPHLHFRQSLWHRAPIDSGDRTAIMRKIRQNLQPLYDFMQESSQP